MNIRTLCLGILSFGDATGYKIRKLSTEGEYSYFVDASFGAIYPALAKLHSEELVTYRYETQSGKPARKVYSITAAGRKAFDDALAEQPGPDIFRSEFLFLMLCAEMMPPELVTQRLNERLVAIEQGIKTLQTLRENCASLTSQWTADYGICCYTASRDFVLRERSRIEEIAGSRIATRQAAE